MSVAYKRRKKLIAHGQWDFSAQRNREYVNPILNDIPPKFFRHLTPAERDLEVAGQLPRVGTTQNQQEQTP